MPTRADRSPCRSQARARGRTGVQDVRRENQQAPATACLCPNVCRLFDTVLPNRFQSRTEVNHQGTKARRISFKMTTVIDRRYSAAEFLASCLGDLVLLSAA